MAMVCLLVKPPDDLARMFALDVQQDVTGNTLSPRDKRRCARLSIVDAVVGASALALKAHLAIMKVRRVVRPPTTLNLRRQMIPPRVHAGKEAQKKRLRDYLRSPCCYGSIFSLTISLRLSSALVSFSLHLLCCYYYQSIRSVLQSRIHDLSPPSLNATQLCVHCSMDVQIQWDYVDMVNFCCCSLFTRQCSQFDQPKHRAWSAARY